LKDINVGWGPHPALGRPVGQPWVRVIHLCHMALPKPGLKTLPHAD